MPVHIFTTAFCVLTDGIPGWVKGDITGQAPPRPDPGPQGEESSLGPALGYQT